MKNYAFIDSQNLNLGILDQGWKLDFKKFRIYLSDKYKVSKAFIFIGYVPNNKKLYSILKKFGYELVFKPTVLDGEKAVKGNVDAELVLHAMVEYRNYDGAVIVSGDGDFRCLVEYLRNNNKLARVLVPNRFKYSALLREFVINIDFLNNLRSKLQKTRGINLRTKP